MSDLPGHDLTALIAEAGIRRTIARYCHAIDDGDFDGLAECFAAQAQLDAFGRTRSGREAVTALLAKAMPPESRGKHLTLNTVVSDLAPADDGAARASAVSDFAFVGKDGSLTTGRYRDEFVCADGNWLIGKREIVISG